MKKVIVVFFLFILSAICSFADVKTEILPSQIGVIEQVEYVDSDIDDKITVKQSVVVRIQNNEDKKQVVIDNMLTGNPFYDIKLSKGMKVLLHVEKINDEILSIKEKIEYLSGVNVDSFETLEGVNRRLNKLESADKEFQKTIEQLNETIKDGVNAKLKWLIL